MIGPHEGKELELMLAGKKYLAAFGDVLPDDGSKINEQIIPENKFAPYVKSGAIKRFERYVRSAKDNRQIFYVCFTLPGHEWRAETILWLREMAHTNRMPIDSAMEIMIGRLLDYDEADIQDFIHKYGK
jgi:hypothetical protein